MPLSSYAFPNRSALTQPQHCSTLNSHRISEAPCVDVYGPRPIATVGWIRIDGHNCRCISGCVMRLDNVFAASLDGLMGFRRFHLKAPMTLVNAMPVHTSGSGSDGVTVSPSPAIGCNWRGGTSFSYWPLLFRPPSPTARPLCGSRPACSQHKPSRPKGCLSTFSWRIWSGRCRCASGRS